MRYFLILLTLLAFIYGCGCANTGLTAPAYGAVGDAYDTWPALYTIDNGGPDYLYFSDYDQGSTSWEQRQIITDALDAQWTPQRNGIGWSTAGEWGAAVIETGSNDLEYWSSGDTGFQDDVGAWGLVDDDTSQNWLTVDIESRQNYIWFATTVAGPIASVGYIDLAAGAPALTLLSTTFTPDTAIISIVLDKYLIGEVHVAGLDNSDGLIKYFSSGPYTWVSSVGWTSTIVAGAYPQILCAEHNELFTFFTNANGLYCFMSKSGAIWLNGEAVYSATELIDAYHATWLAADDTIHVALVDRNLGGNTLLVYMRRTPNGWSAPVTLLTVDSTILGDKDNLLFPQITVDPYKNIFIHYLFDDDITVPPVGGDLQGFYLATGDYDDFATPATWTQYTDLDGGANDVTQVMAPNYIPINGNI